MRFDLSMLYLEQILKRNLTPHNNAYRILKAIRNLPSKCKPIQFIHHYFRGKATLRQAERSLARIDHHNRSFYSKIQYKMAYDRNPELKVLADKVQVRKFVEKRIGARYLISLKLITEDFDLIDFTSLGKNFVIKASHGSGGVIIVWEGAEKNSKFEFNEQTNWERFLINSTDFDISTARQLSKKWLNSSYYWNFGSLPEWAYLNIPPRLIVEDLILDNAGNIPSDYKFFMFNGVCDLIQFDSNRYGRHRRDFFNSRWDKLPMSLLYENSHEEMQKPKYLEEMLQLAKYLSDGFDFVRVDLYESSNGIKFGEMTNYPDCGNCKFIPAKWNYEIGRNWQPTYRG